MMRLFCWIMFDVCCNLFTTHHINLYSRGKRVGLSSSFVLYQKKNEIGYVSCFIFFLNGSVMLDL